MTHDRAALEQQFRDLQKQTGRLQFTTNLSVFDDNSLQAMISGMQQAVGTPSTPAFTPGGLPPDGEGPPPPPPRPPPPPQTPTALPNFGPAPGAQPGQSPFEAFFANRPPGAAGQPGGTDFFKFMSPILSSLGGERLGDFFLSPVGGVVQRNIAEFLNQLGLSPFFNQQAGLADFLSGRIGQTTTDIGQFRNLANILFELGDRNNRALPFSDIQQNLAQQFAGFLNQGGPAAPFQPQEQQLVNTLSGLLSGNFNIQDMIKNLAQQEFGFLEQGGRTAAGFAPEQNEILQTLLRGAQGTSPALAFANALFSPEGLAREAVPRFNILQRQLEQPFQDARQRIISDLARRNVLDSGIAVEPLARLEQERLRQFGNLADQLALGGFESGRQALGQVLPFGTAQAGAFANLLEGARQEDLAKTFGAVRGLENIFGFQQGAAGQLQNLISGRRAEDLQKTFGAVQGLENIFGRTQPMAQQQQQFGLSQLSELLTGQQSRDLQAQIAFADLLNRLTQGAGQQALGIADLGQSGLLQAIQQGFVPFQTLLSTEAARDQLAAARRSAVGSGIAGLAGIIGGLFGVGG